MFYGYYSRLPCLLVFPMKYGKKQTANAMQGDGRLLMVTYSGDGPSYALDNGIGISTRLARELTTPQSVEPIPGDLFLVPNNDGLFEGFTQTWKAL